MTAVRPRVAIYGGDGRVGLIEWPRRLDVRHFPYKSNQAQERLENALASGSIDHLVLLTSYMGHGQWHLSKTASVNVVKWPHSPMQLWRKIDEVIPGGPSDGARLPPPDSPGNAGPRRIMVVTPGAAVKLIAAPTAEEVAAAPSFSAELTRLLKAEGMSQSAFARLVGSCASTVNLWTQGKTPGRRYSAAIVKLLPELAPLLGQNAPPPMAEGTGKWDVRKELDEEVVAPVFGLRFADKMKAAGIDPPAGVVSSAAPPPAVMPAQESTVGRPPIEERLRLAEELTRRWAQHLREALDLERQIRELMDSVRRGG